ncbi:Mediator of RNA polymerase II transcription subunit 5 [Colletotrichum gloeosporioides]|uniref:Mediator of RNA polymerase II transcription subunit 5 n=1 Tax=Colletotrichum gloeosporioides TaxID=474922 RepID=A0A8H4CX56_COLGL|nr:Mediator of RNA polymerase II transcription subunit 5 [Colletotrichum gloeosporioides]KAF3811437.1 Mediator of RNA polymerase II transcription subunit 5 [Colletotrichum gloeosporioides]
MDGRVIRGVQRAALRQWNEFIAKSLATRLDPDKFESYVPFLQAKHPLPPSVVADLFLRPQPHNHESLDPRVPRFLQVLSDLNYIDTPSILEALYKYSTSRAHSREAAQASNGGNPASQTLRWASSYSAEEVMFYRLTKSVAQGTAITNTETGLAIAKIMASWIALFTDAATAFTVDVMGQLQNSQAREEMESARAAFVALLLGVCENHTVMKAFGSPEAKNTRKALSESLANFVPTIMQNAGPIATRLDMFRTSTLAAFEPDDEQKNTSNVEIEDLFDSSVALENFVISELPIVNSRAGLYIYLNAALVGRPLIDDMSIFNYLNNRYQGDVQTTTIDLILASFDVLANAVSRNEGNSAAPLLRSFLMNKLPLLIENLSKHMYPPLTAEFCITEALGRVDTNTFPTLSSMFDESRSNNPFTDSVREEFCWACCLHGLVRESSIEGLLGETPYQNLPAGGRYVKDNLVAECLADPERMQALIGELDGKDGNAGAVCQALTEVLGQLCRNKETMSLKLLCSQLAQRPLSLDVMLLFEKPATILHPLCDLLENWKYDEDQGEYQPVYEEFGSILLLVMAFAYRYNLSVSDLGIVSPDSFVSKLLGQGHQSQVFDELSEQQKGHLDGWIHGLFDSEAGGLGDELMSSCPPQDFYLLVSTLFQNIVLAFSTGHLSEESLRGGVEYLVDTFLLPSLVVAITYLSNSLLIERPECQKAIVRVLKSVLEPTSISKEASDMLSSVMNIVAKPLEHSLRTYQRSDPKSQEIEPLLRAIKDSIPMSRRTGAADHVELEAWSGVQQHQHNHQNVGFANTLRQTLQSLVQWSIHPAIDRPPPTYTHRQILVALNILGAKRLLQLIYEDIRQHSEAGSGSIVYDVAANLVCAPDANDSPWANALNFMDNSGNMRAPIQKKLTMREVLKSDAENCKRLQKIDMNLTEIVVRLHRKVESQMVVAQAAAIQADTMLQNDLGLGLDGGTGSLDDAMAAATANVVTGDGMSVDNVSLDLGMAGEMGLGGPSNAGGGLDLGDNDLFSGLDTGDDFQWDNMDLS